MSQKLIERDKLSTQGTHHQSIVISGKWQCVQPNPYTAKRQFQ